MNCGLAVLGHRLFVYGGQVETEKKERVLDDLHCLDLHKLENWQCLQEASNTVRPAEQIRNSSSPSC